MIITDRTSGILRVAAIITLIIVLAVTISIIPQMNGIIKSNSNTVYFFHGAECSHCHDIIPFINSTMEKYPNIKFEVREIWHNETNNNLAIVMNNKLNKINWGVPEVIIGDVIMIGSKDISENLEGTLNNMTVGVKNA